MDDSGHRENGRNKPDIYKSTQSQWLMQHQPSMKQIMSIMAERDAAIQERNMALNEKNKALEERELAIIQRDTAIRERNEAIMERDNAHAALQHRQNIMNTNNPSCPPGCQIGRGVKHIHHPQQHIQNQPHMGGEASYDPRKITVAEAVPVAAVANETLKVQKVKRPKEPKTVSPNKKSSKPTKKVKKEGDDSSKMMPPNSQQEWKGIHEIGGDEYKELVSLPKIGGDEYKELVSLPKIGGDEYKELVSPKSDWKKKDLGLNQVAYDDSTMPPPVCSCTGVYRQCYKWGNGGWQSACCTTTMSMYPLPAVPNKRHTRVGGRKMSGGAFSKLLSRLAAQGHDLSVPLDLKDHWAKHGTNRYITIR